MTHINTNYIKKHNAIPSQKDILSIRSNFNIQKSRVSQSKYKVESSKNYKMFDSQKVEPGQFACKIFTRTLLNNSNLNGKSNMHDKVYK